MESMLRPLPSGSDICEALSKISSSGIITMNNVQEITLARYYSTITIKKGLEARHCQVQANCCAHRTCEQLRLIKQLISKQNNSRDK